jgi:hypothetical protein
MYSYHCIYIRSKILKFVGYVLSKLVIFNSSAVSSMCVRVSLPPPLTSFGNIFRMCFSNAIPSISFEEIYSISRVIEKYPFTKTSHTLFIMHIIRMIENLVTFMYLKQLRDALCACFRSQTQSGDVPYACIFALALNQVRGPMCVFPSLPSSSK